MIGESEWLMMVVLIMVVVMVVVVVVYVKVFRMTQHRPDEKERSEWKARVR